MLQNIALLPEAEYYITLQLAIYRALGLSSYVNGTQGMCRAAVICIDCIFKT